MTTAIQAAPVSIEETFQRLNAVAPRQIGGLAFYADHTNPYYAHFNDGSESVGAKTLAELEAKLIELSKIELANAEETVKRLQSLTK